MLAFRLGRVRRNIRIAVERLEDRTQPATFAVLNADDSGAGSLRQAIIDANASAGQDDITFAIGTGAQTIALASALPIVTGPTLLLANTQPGFTDPANINPDQFFNSPFPIITIDGTNAGADSDGLVFGPGADGSQAQYLQVRNFGGDGIVFDNAANGLLAFFVSSGNGGNGVLITGDAAKANRLQNGFIGTDETGNVVSANGGDGVLITNNASGNVVGGGNFFQARNVISGNLGNGVHIADGAFGNLEQGNVIGLNTGDNTAIGNALDGVLVEGSGAGNVIGGPLGLGGIKSGNGRHGVSVVGEAPGTIVFNAFAGTSAFSNLAFGNGVDGIHIEASGAGIVVTTNIASANGRYGLYIGGKANGVVVDTALIGVGFPGVFALPNGAGGIIVTDDAKNTVLGVVTPPGAKPAENIVSGNAGPGIIVEGNASGTVIINAAVGGGFTGTVPTPNSGPGILVRGNATGTVIGGTEFEQASAIAFNEGAGVQIETDNPVTLIENTIYDNAGPAIAFDPASAQAAPVLASVRPTDDGALAAGSVAGEPGTTVMIEFFASAKPGADNTGQGQTFLTSSEVEIGDDGVARFSVPLTLPDGQTFVAATATHADGATSAFSNGKVVGPTASVVTGPGSGGGPQVNVFAPDGTPVRAILAYEASFTGQVRVASADVTGDGVADSIVAPGPGGGPRVRVFDGATGLALEGTLGSFFAFASTFTGGVFVAAGDINGDGFADVIAGADAGGGPAVQIFSGVNGSSLGSFFAFESTFRGGVRVAAGDVNGDGLSDVITAAGIGGGPRVVAVSGDDFSNVLADFFAFAPETKGGLFVGAGDLNGFGVASIIAGTASGASDVAWFDAAGTQEGALSAFGDFAGGVRVAAADATGDGIQDVVAGAGPGGGPAVAVFDSLTEDAIDQFFAYDAAFGGGVFVGGS